MSETEMNLTANVEAMTVKYAYSDGFGMPLDAKTFSRYLRARSNNLEQATSMLDATIAWRESFDVVNLHTWSNIMLKENETGKAYVRGHDKQNRPIVWMKPKFENTYDHDGNLKHLVYNLERAVACGEANESSDGKLCLVIDYEGYSIMNAPPMKTSMEVLRILQNHYPERLAKAYMVRPPWIFHSFFSLISPFIDPVTKDKIAMLSSNKHATLVETIDDKFLESSLGGLDTRPFVSSMYLDTKDLSVCYWKQLESAMEKSF
jgi:hypothetical protein